MKPINLMTRHLNELKTAVYPAIVFLNIDVDVVYIIIALMLTDTVFGVLKAYALGNRISFKTLLFGLCTKILIIIIPMVLALIGKGLRYDWTPLVDAVMKILVLAEGYSILTSMYVIKTLKDVKNVDVISLLLSTLRASLMQTIKSIFKTIDKNEDR